MTPTAGMIAIVAGACSLAAGALSWQLRGIQADAEISALRLQYATAQAAAVSQARHIDNIQRGRENEAMQQHAHAREKVLVDLRRDLASMRNRTQRPTTLATAMPDTGDCADAHRSGPELFREDAEFLVWEASRADEIRAGLTACYAVIDR